MTTDTPREVIALVLESTNHPGPPDGVTHQQYLGDADLILAALAEKGWQVTRIPIGAQLFREAIAEEERALLSRSENNNG